MIFHCDIISFSKPCCCNVTFFRFYLCT